jgi:molecular chaperone GrpE
MGPETDRQAWAASEQLEAERARASDNGGTGPPGPAVAGPRHDPAGDAEGAAADRGPESSSAGGGDLLGETVEVSDVLAGEEGGEEGTGEAGLGRTGPPPAPEADLRALLLEVERQRDEYLDTLRRVQADFDNYRKRVERQRHEAADSATAALVKALLPALDTADLALAHGGGEDVKQVVGALFDALAKEGLERIDPEGQAFNPEHHDAIAHEPGVALGDDSAPPEAGHQQPLVSEVMRAGYRWRGRVLRPAMVKVRG